MKWTGLNELRERYLTFFESKGHLQLGSFPLVPQGDNSLLLINSGMAPLKKWFTGQETPPRKRVTTCQKCIRTPDIERVGKTARHGTFFEMLGNFSFGDYFKREATAWAWEFLTKELEIPRELLYISIFEDDDEAYDIWTKEVGIAPEHMVRLGREDNFWEIGSGPCGPCSEIYFDRGEKYGCGKDTCAVGCDCDRYIEIWNLVFTQFISDGAGGYERMSHPNIDTGMGLERLAVVMQDVDNLFEVDTIQNIMREVERMAGITYKEDEQKDISIRVICDHIRSTVFMVGDGVLPSNEGRGYVLRRLLRRAARHGRMLGIKSGFLSELCDKVISENINAYPYLNENSAYIKRVIAEEEKRFNTTIDAGLNMLNVIMEKIEPINGIRTLLGEDVFKLNDTFGFPLDLTREIAEENGIALDETTFFNLLNEQRQRARDARLKNENVGWAEDSFQGLNAPATVFNGYDELTVESTVTALAYDGEQTDAITTDDGEKEGVMVVLAATPFYAEGGGQVADTGIITTAGGAVLKVLGCRKTGHGHYVHTCTLENGTVKTGEKVTAAVDKQARMATARNHTAAHLLQAGLQHVLGSHVHQAGSFVSPERLRFDFNHFSAVTKEELHKVEDFVNNAIFEAADVAAKEMPVDAAKAAGAIALFGEKYGDIVRVVTVEGVSSELCGGTHITNTAQLGLFKIVGESSVAAGVRRIEAVTGQGVLAMLSERETLLTKTAEALKASSFMEVVNRATAFVQEMRTMEKSIAELRGKMAGGNAEALLASGKTAGAVTVYTGRYELGPDALRAMGDMLRKRDKYAVAVICGEENGKANLMACCGDAAIAAGVKAGPLVKAVAALAGGNGGGKADIAMGGIQNIGDIDAALAATLEIVKGMQ